MVQPFKIHELLAINLQVHAWYLETLVESLQSNFQSDWKFAWNFACKLSRVDWNFACKLSRVDWNFACKLSRVDCKFACKLAGVPWKFAVKLSILIFITIKKINKVWKFDLKLSMHHWKFACKLSTLHWKFACKLAIYPWKFACKVAGKLSTILKVWLQTFNQSFNIMLMFLWFLSQKHKFSKKKNEWNNHTMVKKNLNMANEWTQTCVTLQLVPLQQAFFSWKNEASCRLQEDCHLEPVDNESGSHPNAKAALIWTAIIIPKVILNSQVILMPKVILN